VICIADLVAKLVYSPDLEVPGWGYSRWGGDVSGGFESQESVNESAVYEWMRFINA